MDSARPTLTFTNAVGLRVPLNLPHEIEIQDANGSVVYSRIIPESQTTGSHTVEQDLPPGTFWWRVRARYLERFGPWSGFATIQTPALFGPGGAVGPPRNIGIGEAVSIIRAIYNAGGYDIGSRSNRNQRNVYLETAVAVLHYGHSVWNPKGPDRNWCLKNGGGGRPQADDVIARCDTRDAWDLVRSIGSSGYAWNPSYIGRLPSVQQIYPPPEHAVARAPQQ